MSTSAVTQVLQHISYLTSNITYATPSGLNWSITGKGWVGGKLTFSRNCSLPLRLNQGISIAVLSYRARFILRICVDLAQIMDVMCGVRGCVMRHNLGRHICSCLHACSMTFTPLWILLCGILRFSLSWGAADYYKKAAWHHFCCRQTSRDRLAFPVNAVEWEAVNPGRCEGLYIGIT